MSSATPSLKGPTYINLTNVANSMVPEPGETRGEGLIMDYPNINFYNVIYFEGWELLPASRACKIQTYLRNGLRKLFIEGHPQGASGE